MKKGDNCSIVGQVNSFCSVLAIFGRQLNRALGKKMGFRSGSSK